MGTPFTEIYDLFLSNVDSYSLFNLLEEDEESFKEECKNWLVQAIVSNPIISSRTTNFDRDIDTFDNVLSDVDKVMLAKAMVVEYLNPFIITENALRSNLNSRDYRTYSPQGNRDSLVKTKQSLQDDITKLSIQHTYSMENLEKLLGKKK